MAQKRPSTARQNPLIALAKKGATLCAHPEQGPWGLFRYLLYPQNPIFGTHKEMCAKKWVLRGHQLPLHGPLGAV